MAIRKINFILAFLITVSIFGFIVVSNLRINNEREKVVLEKMDVVLEEFKELETITLLSGVFGDEMSCLAFREQLSSMDDSLWSAGQKIDRYRELTEEFIKDPFFIEQKIRFNRNQMMYFSMLKNMKKKCDVDQTILLFFYKKKEECSDCDAQSFVLTDINKKIDDEISIFSLDADLNVSSVNLLIKYYKIDEFPCIVIEDEKHCGLIKGDDLIEELCKKSNLSVCTN